MNVTVRPWSDGAFRRTCCGRNRERVIAAQADGAYSFVVARSRIRSIVVEDIAYRWTVGLVDPGHVRVKVWHDAPRRGGALEVMVAFDDPWLNYGPIITAPAGRAAEVFELNPIAPALVAKIVREALGAGWQAHHSGTTRFQLTRDRERLEPSPQMTGRRALPCTPPAQTARRITPPD
ncbi:hypothetical protein QLQ12_12730 [Actinoplanes sp. NEAU-A12]|uniref:Uncharacterized protein n=1 Tax=Actinoplanes sandaracinus TaxID=3045177 RepID=A0ABT6WIB5_9ACTN|nr:hypothetical protein [Actinoplanes sandaracinus]MDI6099460.1 hypothetical protein [Actinoplanes sandaracinus]